MRSETGSSNRQPGFALITAAVVLALVSARDIQASSSEQPSSYSSEVTQLLEKRHKLQGELQRLDQQAIEALKRGEERVATYARQSTVQARLDLVDLRIQVIASREGVPIPIEESVIAEAPETSPALALRPMDFFEVGRARTRSAWRKQCREFFRSLDFSRFLDPNA